MGTLAWKYLAHIVTVLLVAPILAGGVGTASQIDASDVHDEVVPAARVVPGAAPVDARAIGGSSGQDIAANFPLSHAGPAAKTITADALWWEWAAPHTGSMRFSTVGSEIDTAIKIRRGSPSGPLVARGSDAGDVATAETTFRAQAGETYFIEVESEGRNPAPGLVVLSWQVATRDLSRDQGPDIAAQEVVDLFGASNIPLVGTTGEKPQSKLWRAEGTWWAVLASSVPSPPATWVWRFDGVSWTAVTRISDSADVRADVLPGDGAVHVFLHGPQSALVSLQYDDALHAYVPWADRAAPAIISLPGSETATIDTDGTGRMWIATETPNSIQVRYADHPYDNFSEPITVATGITEDDIAVVTALPGRVAVMWSNQNTQRFGFRTHLDGAPPTSWTADEVPGSGSALPIGGGMADDHVNVAVADDGTLYAAVKTSYNSASRPVIGLLVRHPNGVWEPLHEVDRRGTRPIVLIDEETDSVRVIYTASEYLDNILEKVTKLGDLDFSGDAEILVRGAYNNVTSVKRNADEEVLVLAGGASSAGMAHIEWTDPDAPMLVDTTVMTKVDTPITAAWGIDEPVDEVQILTGPTCGDVTQTELVGFTYEPCTGFVGTESLTYRVRLGELWSRTATVTIGVSDDESLLGAWSLDDGSGTTIGDASIWKLDGAIEGGTQWITGVAGGHALRLDGHSGRATIPHSPIYSDTDELTVAAWVRPQKIDTQYVVKKAEGGAIDGFELSFASSGLPYFRLNQASAGNAFRLLADRVPVADGSTWTHLAATYDGTTMRLYLDGQLTGSLRGPSELRSNTLPLIFGGQTSGTYPYQGDLDEVRLYARALSGTEITALALTDPPPPDPEPPSEPPPGPIEEGAVGFWGFDESSGQVAVDGSGMSNDGVFSGGVARVEGQHEGAVQLNGSTGRVTVADAPSLDVSGPLTLAAWVRPDRTATQYVMKKAQGYSVDGYELALASTGRPFFRVNEASNGNAFRVDGPSVVAVDGTWTHLVGVFDGSQLRLYVDGELVSTKPGPSAVAVNGLPLVIGNQPGNEYPFAGGIDEARVYERALSSQEITELADFAG